MSEVLKIFKIGGGIIDDTAQLSFFLSELAQVVGKKIVVHGGGKGANELLTRLGMLPNMVNGRRITEAGFMRFKLNRPLNRCKTRRFFLETLPARL